MCLSLFLLLLGRIGVDWVYGVGFNLLTSKRQKQIPGGEAGVSLWGLNNSYPSAVGFSKEAKSRLL